jgi:hypothetical protein
MRTQRDLMSALGVIADIICAKADIRQVANCRFMSAIGGKYWTFGQLDFRLHIFKIKSYFLVAGRK